MATPTPAATTVYKDNLCPSTAIWNSYNTCGTITRADIGLANPSDLETIFKQTSSAGLGVTANEGSETVTRRFGGFDLGRQGGLEVLDQVDVAKLNSTLSALSDGVRGQGERIGEATTAANQVLLELNPRNETIRADLQALTSFNRTFFFNYYLGEGEFL